MSNVRYLNQPNSFWDFIASLDSAGSSHPFANAYNNESRESRGPPPEYPGWGSHPDHPEPPQSPPPPHHEGPPPPDSRSGPEHHHGPPHHDHPFGPGFPFGGRRGGPHHHGGPHGGPHGHRGGWGGRRGGGRWGGGREHGFGGWNAGNFDMNKIAEFVSQFVPEDIMKQAGTNKEPTNTNDKNSSDKDFTPPADIFDTEDAYIVHISLPGAKKEDVGVNWDADKSELNVAGVIYRPGDEQLLKALALDERQVGVFERKVKLGSRAVPAAVDSEGIGAKMEDGILMVTIPKIGKEDFVEVKKVDIE
ncbi:hypothetical protein MMC28_000515 [Mycoblastus sanguinarius]|nr:hypothetical protein [Mycoblastus sanguinarius]